MPSYCFGLYAVHYVSSTISKPCPNPYGVSLWVLLLLLILPNLVECYVCPPLHNFFLPPHLFPSLYCKLKPLSWCSLTIAGFGIFSFGQIWKLGGLDTFCIWCGVISGVSCIFSCFLLFLFLVFFWFWVYFSYTQVILFVLLSYFMESKLLMFKKKLNPLSSLYKPFLCIHVWTILNGIPWFSLPLEQHLAFLVCTHP